MIRDSEGRRVERSKVWAGIITGLSRHRKGTEQVNKLDHIN